MDVKKASLTMGLIVGVSIIINLFFNWVVPRHEFSNEIIQLKESIRTIEKQLPQLLNKIEFMEEINRLEIVMMENTLSRLEQARCEQAYGTLDEYLLCVQDQEYKSALRYFELNRK